MKKLWLLLFLLGCAVGPDYKAPENTISDSWKGESTFSTSEPVTDWWDVFEDPLLTKYIHMAAENNNDILKAEANVLQARGLKQVAASSLFPQFTADWNGTKTYFSKNGPIFAIGPATGNLPGTVSPTTGLPFSVQIPQIQPLYNALIDATWEVDIFGKIRRGVEAAQATIESMIEQKNDTLLTVLAEVALNYIELRGQQKLAKLIEENIHFLEENVEIIQMSLERGLVGQLNLETIEAQLSTARSTLPEVNAQIYRSIYTLSVLTGHLPEFLVDELLPEEPLPKAPHEISIGLRSDLLRRRPDIRQSERELATATANLGVAVASFYPTVTLLGDGGVQSLRLNNLFQSRSKTWAFGGDINLPIFQGGSLVGNLHANRANVSAAAYAYQQTVLNAIEDAENGLVTYREAVKKARELKEVALHDSNITRLTEERFEKGLDNKIALLNAEIQLNGAEQTLLNSEIAALVDLIALYKALGGGWEADFNSDLPAADVVSGEDNTKSQNPEDPDSK